MSKLVQANEATASRRRVTFHIVAADGITPATTEAGGQPQISTNGAAWTGTGIGVLVAIGNGRYYADLTQAAVLTAGDQIETRYKDSDTAECPGDSFQVIAPSLVDAVRGFSGTALPAVAAGANGGLPLGDASGRVTVASLVAGAIVAATIGDGAITAAKIADDAITAAKIATGAIDADALATDAGTEIANAILDLANGIETSMTLRQFCRAILAIDSGLTTRNGNQTDYKRRDGTTTAISVTAAGDGARSASTIGTL